MSRHAARLEGKVVLITGASSGIGRSLALELGRAGAKLGVLARRADRLNALAAEIGTQSEVCVLPCDVSNDAACKEAVQTLAAEHGAIDLAINNAGVSMNTMFEDTDVGVFRRLMDVNYFGSLYIARHCLPHLERSRGGLVFVSSIVGRRGFPTRSGYCASKFAVHALFESLRVEWADKGVHVGIVAPGYTDTEIRRSALGGGPAAAKPVGEVMSSEAAARAIIGAAVLRKREVILTTSGRAMVWLNKLFPALADRAAALAVR